MFWKLFDFGLEVLSQADWISPTLDTLRGFNEGVLFTPDGTSATFTQDYLQSHGIKSKLHKPLFGDWIVTVRGEDYKLARSLLSKKWMR